MAVNCLTSIQKGLIAQWYKDKIYTQKELASHYKVSARTINRVLEEKGLATPVARIQGEAYQVMQILKNYGMNAAQLKAALAAPALTKENVQWYLNQCSKEELAAMFYTSGLIKISEMLQKPIAPIPTKNQQEMFNEPVSG